MQTGPPDLDESPQKTKSKPGRSEVKGMNRGRTFRTFIFFFSQISFFIQLKEDFVSVFFSEVVEVGAMI